MNKQKLLKNCILLMEPYYNLMRGSYDHNKLYRLNDADMKLWKESYYKELLQYPEIEDTAFIQPPGEANPNYGIGADGVFSRFEYCNFYYQLYRHMVYSLLPNPAEVLKYRSLPGDVTFPLWNLLNILESYVPQFAHKGGSDLVTASFSDEHRKKWDMFYEWNVKNHILADGEFFGDIKSNPNLGIGKDGVFFGAELLHFLGNCYKYIVQYNNQKEEVL